MDQNKFLPVVSKTFSQYLITCSFKAVRQDVKSRDNLVVVQDMAINFGVCAFKVINTEYTYLESDQHWF